MIEKRHCSCRLNALVSTSYCITLPRKPASTQQQYIRDDAILSSNRFPLIAARVARVPIAVPPPSRAFLVGPAKVTSYAVGPNSDEETRRTRSNSPVMAERMSSFTPPKDGTLSSDPARALRVRETLLKGIRILTSSNHPFLLLLFSFSFFSVFSRTPANEEFPGQGRRNQSLLIARLRSLISAFCNHNILRIRRRGLLRP